jgi:hypothetical protein
LPRARLAATMMKRYVLASLSSGITFLLLLLRILSDLR